MTARGLSGLLFLPQAQAAVKREARSEWTDEQLEARLFHMHRRRRTPACITCPCMPLLQNDEEMCLTLQAGHAHKKKWREEHKVLCFIPQVFACCALPRSFSMHREPAPSFLLRQVELNAERKAVRMEPSQRGNNKRMVRAQLLSSLLVICLLVICLGMPLVITHTDLKPVLSCPARVPLPSDLPAEGVAPDLPAAGALPGTADDGVLRQGGLQIVQICQRCSLCPPHLVITGTRCLAADIRLR